MRTLLFLLGSAAALPLAGQTVTATGTGEIRLAPDWALVTIGITTRDATAAAARREHGAVVQRVWEALARAGVPRDSVRTAWTRVAPVIDYEHAREIRGYEAVTGLRVPVRDLERLSGVLAGALGAGATDVSQIERRSTREMAARTEALQRAVTAARADARAMAAAIDGSLGPLVELTTAPEASPMPRGEVMMMRSQAEGGPELTELVITVMVRGTWRFVPAAR
jgi:hypothetical protein